MGKRAMNADEYRRKAEHFLTLAQQLASPQDRAAMIAMAAYWKDRADEVEQNERIQQQQQQTQPEKKEPRVEALQARNEDR